MVTPKKKRKMILKLSILEFLRIGFLDELINRYTDQYCPQKKLKFLPTRRNKNQQTE